MLKPRYTGTRFVWDGDVIAEEIPILEGEKLDLENRVLWHFEPGSFRPIAKEVGENLSFIVTDHLGTPKELFDEKGEVLWGASHHLWGSIRQIWTKPRIKRAVNGAILEEEAETCPIRFQGQWEDEESGLYYNRYRHYDPLAGSYVSSDPIGLTGGDRPNGYVTNPITLIDKLGLKAVAEAKSWQGKGDYTGVDNWQPHQFKEGDIVAAGSPGQGNFYTTRETVNAALQDKNLLGKIIQVKPHPEKGIRPDITLYRVNKSFTGASSKANANPQFGAGGGDQFFVPNDAIGNLTPIQTMPLNSYNPIPLGESSVYPR